MTNNSTIQPTTDFNTFFDELWRNRHNVPLQINNLLEDIEFIKNYYSSESSYFISFDISRLSEPDFLKEIESLTEKGLNIDKSKGLIELPIDYIKSNISNDELSKLATHFKNIESRFNSNSLYIENKKLFEKFKIDYSIV